MDELYDASGEEAEQIRERAMLQEEATMNSIRKSRGNTFAQWLERMHALQHKDGARTETAPYCDDEAWRSRYDDNDSPEEAWSEEKSYAIADGG